MRMRRWARFGRKVLVVLLLAWLLLGAAALLPAEEDSGEVAVITIAGTINNGVAEYVTTSIDAAEQRHDRALVIEMDTPGGALNATEDMVKRMMSARVPVVVYVWPKAGQAASAGTFITMAAHVAAMAPGSRIGAAHPVSLPLFIGQDDKDPNKKKEGAEQRDIMGEKVENDTVSFMVGIAKERGRNYEWAEKAVRQSVSITADVALDDKVVDLVADTLDELLQKIDGREIKLDKDTTVTLKTKGVPVHRYGMSLKQRLLNFLTDPNLLMVLFTLGGLGILMEFYHPGSILPGAVGALCLLLAFMSMQLLPVSAVGIILMLAGIGLFVAEVYVTSYGLLGVAGAALFLTGGILLVDPTSSSQPYFTDQSISVSWSVLIPMVLTIAGAFFYIGFAVIRAQRRRVATGVEGMVGLVGEARSEVGPQGGQVFVRGEIWGAQCPETLPPGTPIQVVQVEGLKVFVKKAP